MVGIILASHGDLAPGILQSGSMIFGEQPNVKACSLLPSESPETIRDKMLEAIASFDSQDEVLFLVDLWGGTPFNQASLLLKGHEDKWAIMTGLSLPMLLEAYGARMAGENAVGIVKTVFNLAKDGIKLLPESLEPKKVSVKTNSIPEGTKVGNGKIEYVLARVDTRLLHGQVATSWTKLANPHRIIVVSDSVSKDDLRKQMIIQACPPGVKTHVVPVEKMIAVAKDPRFGGTKAMLLFETPSDALRAIKGGVDIKDLNLGSIAHSNGKVFCTKAVSVGQEDYDALKELLALGVKINVRKVPADSDENIEKVLEKAKQGLN